MRKFISAAIAFAMTATAFAGMTVARAAYTGAGTEADPYIITDVGDWKTGLNGKGYYKLGVDIEPSSGIRLQYDTVLDLNGHNITASVTKSIETNADVTIKDSTGNKAKIESTGGVTIQVNTGNLTIDGITVKAYTTAVAVGGNVPEDTVLTISNSIIHGNTTAVSAQRESVVLNNVTATSGTAGATIAATSGSVTINGGSYSRPDVTGKAYVVNAAGTSNVTINGATITSSTAEAAPVNLVKGLTGTVTINSGTFANTAANKNYVLQDATEAEGAKLIINGGSFTGTLNKNSSKNKAVININGGTFSFDPTTYVDTTSYDVTDNGNGKWTVTAKAAPPAPAASYFTVDGTVDKAGTYTKVNVTADIDGDTKTATKELSTTLTLNDADAVSIGIAVTGIPDGTTFEITRITLE